MFIPSMLTCTLMIPYEWSRHSWGFVAAFGFLFIVLSVTLEVRIREAREAYDMMILDTLKGLGGESTTIGLYEHMEDVMGLKPSLGAIYVALDRLEIQGLIELSEVPSSNPNRPCPYLVATVVK